MISGDGVSTDPTKIKAITIWPQPSNVKELRSFPGLAVFYRWFVRHYVIISKSLTVLLKKNELFVWTEDHTTAFNTLKQSPSSAPVLALLDFTETFCIETNACLTSVCAVLLQQGHPLAFMSKSLGPRNQGLSTYEKEYMAILIAVEKWRSYLQMAEFIIYID